MRHDAASEHAVDVGIQLQELLGTIDAALFLKEQVIHIDVALRVLLQPARRRDPSRAQKMFGPRTPP